MVRPTLYPLALPSDPTAHQTARIPEAGDPHSARSPSNFRWPSAVAMTSNTRFGEFGRTFISFSDRPYREDSNK